MIFTKNPAKTSFIWSSINFYPEFTLQATNIKPLRGFLLFKNLHGNYSDITAIRNIMRLP